MHGKNQVFENPLKPLGFQTDDIIPEGGFGAALARSGVGKTSFMVQLSINAMLRNTNVLHVSLNDPVKKISIWYKEVFNHLAGFYNLQDLNQVWETLLPKRFIMTLKVDGFSVAGFEERLSDLIEQDIFKPEMMIIDGIPFDGSGRPVLAELKSIAEKHSLRVWFTVLTHRHEDPGPGVMPPQLDGIDDLFDVVFKLEPEKKDLRIKAIKGGSDDSDASLILDPATMLIKNG